MMVKPKSTSWDLGGGINSAVFTVNPDKDYLSAKKVCVMRVFGSHYITHLFLWLADYSWAIYRPIFCVRKDIGES